MDTRLHVRGAQLILACGALVAAWTASPVTNACAPPACEVGTQVPGDLSSVPANLPGVFWHTDEGVDATLESVRLVRVADDYEVPLALVVLGDGRHEIELLEPLAPDAAHTLILGSVCGGSGLADDSARQIALETMGERPLPDGSLGELIAGELQHGPLGLASIGGGCSESIESAYVDVAVTLDAVVSPWKDALVYETRVDGSLWSPVGFLPLPPPEGESWLGRAVDRVFATCEDGQDLVDLGLGEGTHEVEIRARIPGTDITLASTRAEVLLSCAESGSTSGDGTSTGATSTGEDPTAGSASSGGGDPASTTDAGSGSGSGDDPLDPDPKVGCSCHTSTVGDPAALLVVLLAGLGRRRSGARRRASRRGGESCRSSSPPGDGGGLGDVR